MRDKGGGVRDGGGGGGWRHRRGSHLGISDETRECMGWMRSDRGKSHIKNGKERWGKR